MTLVHAMWDSNLNALTNSERQDIFKHHCRILVVVILPQQYMSIEGSRQWEAALGLRLAHDREYLVIGLKEHTLPTPWCSNDRHVDAPLGAKLHGLKWGSYLVPIAIPLRKARFCPVLPTT